MKLYYYKESVGGTESLCGSCNSLLSICICIYLLVGRMAAYLSSILVVRSIISLRRAGQAREIAASEFECHAVHNMDLFSSSLHI